MDTFTENEILLNAINMASAELGLLGDSAKAARDELTRQAITQEYYYGAKKTNDLFEIEKSVFLSSQKSSNLSTVDKLSWWREMLDKYSGDYRVILECNEEIFSLTRELVDSINSVSFTYIDERAYFNDWIEYEDDAVSSFLRIKQRNREFLDNSLITYNEYCSNVKTAGTKLYEGRIEQSERWLEHELKYNDLSTADYIEGLRRMARYTEEYYSAGLITYREYADGIQSINEFITDKTNELNEEIYTNWQTSADNWKRQRDTYGDWELFGDSEIDYYIRCIDKIDELYRSGTISRQEYSDQTMEYNMLLFQAQEKAVDKIFSNQSKYISDLKSQYEREERDLKENYDSSDRYSQMEEIRTQMDIYEHAVTSRGIKKYEDLSEQLKDLEREEQMYRLEQEHQATLDELQSDYNEAETKKQQLLWDIRGADFNITDVCNNIKNSQTVYQNNMLLLITQAIQAINNIDVEVYNDNSTHTTNTTQYKKDGTPRLEIAHGYYG